MNTFKIIIQETSPTGEDGAPEIVEIFSQRLTEINLPHLIRAINTVPKGRKPRTGDKKKEVAA